MKRPKKSLGSAKFTALAQTHKLKILENIERRRERFRVSQLERAYTKKEEYLRHFPKVLESEIGKPVVKKTPHGPIQPHEWKLRGAARPAALIARIQAGELDQNGEEFPKPIETFDLLSKVKKEGRMAENAETRELLRILKDLAKALCETGMTQRGIQSYQKYLRFDPSDAFGICGDYVSTLLHNNEACQARHILEQNPDKLSHSATLAYSHTLIEYISWEILQEKGSSEKAVRESFVRAFKCNPFIAVFLAAHETFTKVVEYVDEIKTPAKAGSIEKSFLYASKNIDLWCDTTGACAWIQKELDQLPEPIATVTDAMDEMYLGMYQTAVEMHKEQMRDCDADEE